MKKSGDCSSCLAAVIVAAFFAGMAVVMAFLQNFQNVVR
jgi:hypothetical protein